MVKVARSIIRFAHKQTSSLRLKNTVLLSSIPDFSESTVEVFNQMLKTDAFKAYTFIWFCVEPRKHKHRQRPNVKVKKRVDNPLLRLINLYCESTAKYCIYTHELLGNIYNESQLRIYIEHGSFGLKKPIGNVGHFDYSTYRIRTHRISLTDKVRVCGLPRNDRLFDNAEEVLKNCNIEGFDKVIIWMPTFKHYRFKGLFHLKRNDYNTQKEYDITLQEDPSFYDRVNETLLAHNTLLIIKYHHGQDMRYVETKEASNLKIIQDEALAASGVALYSLLGAADALITDFSSVCYDYLLTNKPIGYDVTDLALYEKSGSLWANNPLDYMPGHKIYSVGDLCDFIASVANNDDHFEAARIKLKDCIHVYQDNQSAKRVVDLIMAESGQSAKR
jgi:hypothetical protein